MKLTRRRLLAYSGVAGASLTAKGLTAKSWTSLVRGDTPSNRIRVGVIGTGFRGKSLIGDLPASVPVQAICDCATSRMAETFQPKAPFKEVLADFHGEQARHCSTHQDYRRMFDQTELDAVTIATPDHHHVQAAMLALQAGLDVYLEKPLSVTIREGRLLADAVKATGRLLQVGSQQRSMEMNRFACEFIRDGGLGKVSRIDTVQYALGMDDSGPVRIEPIRDISEEALAKDWEKKWFKKTPKPTGRFSDDPRFMPVKLTYASGVTVHLLPGVNDATFYGEQGEMRISRNKFKCEPADLIKNAPDASAATRWEGRGIVARPHLQNWLDCIQSRQTPNAPVEIGHRTITVCHLVNIARELNRPLQWNPETEQVVNDSEADHLLDRPRREHFHTPRMR